MNFLAHIYLSGTDPKVMVGNFIGDFVKGKAALMQFEPAIIRGIDLHRSIDAFTDTHPIVTESKNRLRPKYRHYAGVIVDVFYDHFLARHWSTFHDIELAVFASNAYQTISTFQSILPTRVNEMLPYMIRGNWLVNYGKVEGIDRALTGMSRRTPYQSRMDEAKDDLIRFYELFDQEFMYFFPELKKYCDEKRNGWTSTGVEY